ncbi:DNA/RNA non-specific endonuclease [uncultured Alistipes sp.]|jgi:DNA/RNA non-specific endonuclease|uniref:DNA/RNA non-specific endonuclease n=1 Tax=uncultured Alistipes sp. TaxID=538949 RepID=UPI002600A1E4|nr:DNA/RNA non-specific endonuclease [uncultured Alistipes sp.]
MKKLLFILFLGLSAAFVACEDSDRTDKGTYWLVTPQTEVSGTSVEMTCETKFAENVLAASDCGFIYAVIGGGGIGEFTNAKYVSIEGKTIIANLYGLKSYTAYAAYAYVDLPGGGRALSDRIVFMTTEGDDPGPVAEPEFGEPVHSNVTSSSATVSCEFTYDGDDAVKDVYFLYAAEGENSLRKAVSKDEGIKAASLSGLNASTSYTFQLCVEFKDRIFKSAEGTFTTEQGDGVAPTFGTPGSADVTASSATVTCSFAYDGTKTVSRVYFLYTSPTGDTKEAAVSDTTPGTKNAALSELTASTAYTFRLCVEIDGQDYKSAEGTFTTPKGEVPVPAFGTPAYSAVTASSATVNCSFTYDGTETISRVYFQYSSSTGGVQEAAVSDTAPGTKSATLSGLSASTAYSFQLNVVIGGNTYSSAATAFTTEASSGGGQTKYAGWAELPTWEKTITDYHYVDHFCAMGTSSSSPKARNFSACFSAAMKCPVWVAAPLHDAYAVKNVDRKDSYGNDPDISSSIQVGKWSGYTRGHMLGSAERLVSREANNQVMYFSNIGPQLGQAAWFNTGGGAWNTAEDWVDKQWRGLADTCYQVVGTYWANTNKVVSGTTIPTDYYLVLLKVKKSAGKKWAVNCTRDELQCIGVWIQHKNYSKSEVVKPADYASKGIFMTVSQVEAKTGHKFFTNVPNAPKDIYNVSDWNF